jgi:hypothetical protein
MPKMKLKISRIAEVGRIRKHTHTVTGEIEIEAATTEELIKINTAAKLHIT